MSSCARIFSSLYLWLNEWIFAQWNRNRLSSTHFGLWRRLDWIGLDWIEWSEAERRRQTCFLWTWPPLFRASALFVKINNFANFSRYLYCLSGSAYSSSNQLLLFAPMAVSLSRVTSLGLSISKVDSISTVTASLDCQVRFKRREKLVLRQW